MVSKGDKSKERKRIESELRTSTLRYFASFYLHKKSIELRSMLIKLNQK